MIQKNGKGVWEITKPKTFLTLLSILIILASGVSSYTWQKFTLQEHEKRLITLEENCVSKEKHEDSLELINTKLANVEDDVTYIRGKLDSMLKTLE